MPDHPSRLDRMYAHLLQDHPYGWALYKKVTADKIFPGACGYFDSDGDWQTLVNLMDPTSLSRQNLTALEKDEEGGEESSTCEPEILTWGPKQSGSIRSSSVGGEIGLSVGVAPVEPSVNMSFESDNQESAVLITESPVSKRHIKHEVRAEQWMAANTRTMAGQYSEILKRHGIWIVTKTYCTQRCAIAVMTTRTSKVEIGLSADVQGVLTLTPHTRWGRCTGNSCTELHEDRDAGVVVFMSGMYFTPKFLRSTLASTRDQAKQSKHILREGWGDGDDMELGVRYYPSEEEDE
ncbi:hypothetical protein BO78DRAFT_351287, partial [Aspergillus sclerotiicarbonarius CBS 121057]